MAYSIMLILVFPFTFLPINRSSLQSPYRFFSPNQTLFCIFLQYFIGILVYQVANEHYIIPVYKYLREFHKTAFVRYYQAMLL